MFDLLLVIAGANLAGTVTNNTARRANYRESFVKRFLQAGLAIIVGCTCNNVAATAQTSAVQTQTVKASSADGFVDSIGVNVHMSDIGSVYSDYPNVKNALLTLGVRHLRDGLNNSKSAAFFANHNALGELGIKSIFTASIGQSPELWQSFPTLMNQCFEGYENANEMDDQGDSNWLSELLGEMPALSSAVRGKSNSFPVYGPALVYQQSFSELGNVSEYFDYGNLHNYPGGQNPETTGWGARDAEGNLYGSMPWQLDLLNIDSPGLPWVTTETGYTNEQSLAYYVPKWVAATYLPRLVLYNWAHGAQQTYIYELVSDLGGDYGLIDANWNPKPDFYALANLLTLLSDPGPYFQEGSLNYGIGGGDSNVHHILFQKRNGTFYLALWLGESCYDVATGQSLYVTPEVLNVQLPAGMQVTRYQWDASGNVTTTALTSSDLANLWINGKLTILEISPAN